MRLIKNHLVRIFGSKELESSHPSLTIPNGYSLVTPQEKHFQSWRNARQRDRSFFQPYEPKWPTDDLSKAAFDLRVKQAKQHKIKKDGVSLFILDQNFEVIGGVNIFNVRRGASQSAFVGYWLCKKFNGQGIMSAAVKTVCDFSFNQLGLERIEASCLPNNTLSKNLLIRCDFKEEGICRSFLEINGERKDHLLFARIK